MKVKELIEHLQKFDGELEVYMWTDHGQMPQKSGEPEIRYTDEELTYNMWDGSYSESDIIDNEFSEEELAAMNKFVMI